jgi:hypothetical protein
MFLDNTNFQFFTPKSEPNCRQAASQPNLTIHPLPQQAFCISGKGPIEVSTAHLHPARFGNGRTSDNRLSVAVQIFALLTSC